MTLEVDFLPIANGGGANVESQAQYVIDLGSGGALENGLLAGLARSDQVNKVLRQASMMTAAIANTISQGLQVNVIDNGDLSALIALLQQAGIGTARAKLLADTSFYVNASTGNNSNNGTSSGTAWATLQHAVDYLTANVDLAGHIVTVHAAAGTYGPIVCDSRLPGQNGPESLIFLGDTATPANCLISAVNATCGAVFSGGAFTIKGFKLSATGGPVGEGTGLQAYDTGSMIYFDHIDFGSCSNFHMESANGGQIFGGPPSATYTISAAADSHMYAHDYGLIDINTASVTITGTPTWGTACAYVTDLGNLSAGGVTFTGSALGVKYGAHLTSLINTWGGGLSYFPGSAYGTVDTLAQYV